MKSYLPTNLHPDDLLAFNDVRQAMFRVAKQYELPLRTITPYVMPLSGMADRMGDCSHTGDIRIVMRCTVDGHFCDAPLSPDEIWDTAAHELAHLRHHDHSDRHTEFMQELYTALRNVPVDHRQKTIDKLLKMQKARDGEKEVGNEAAAEAFAAAINRMMIENELHPSDLDYARAMDDDPVIEVKSDLSKYRLNKKSRIAWQEQLARIVANGHLCKFLVAPGTNAIWFVGTRSHATVAEYVFGVLVSSAHTMSQRAYYRHEQTAVATHGKRKMLVPGFTASWLNAFVERVDERLTEAREAAVKQADETIPGGKSTALMRLNGQLIKAQKYVDDKFAGRKGSINGLASARGNHPEGRKQGRAAADAMPIGRRGVTGGKTVKGLLK